MCGEGGMGSSNTASVQMQGEASGYAGQPTGTREWPRLGGRSSSGWRGQIQMCGIRMGSQREGKGGMGRAGWPAGPRELFQRTGPETPPQLPDLQPAPTLPGTSRPQAWGCAHPVPNTQDSACGSTSTSVSPSAARWGTGVSSP